MATTRTSLFSRVLGQIGNYLIPDHVKRIMFIVTLYHYMIDDPKNEKLDGLEELSESMKLAKTSANALVLPGYLTERIWTQSTIDRLLRVTPGANTRRVFKLIPCWLHYGRASDIANDIDSLRKYVKSHPAT